MSDPPLPNFLVIGTMKGGTTSLFRYLGAHPEIGVASHKEIEFFSDDTNWGRGVDWYREHFRGLGVPDAIGECSTGYTKYPSHPCAAERIAITLRDPALVYVVRDPIERIRSHYEHSQIRAGEHRPIEEVVLTDPEYLDISRYALQLNQYLPHFDSDRILLVDSQDLRDRRRETMHTIFSFLEVEPNWWDDALVVEHYQTAERRELRSPGRLLSGPGAKRVAHRLTSARLRKRLAGGKLLSSRHAATRQRASVSPALRDELRRRLADDVAELDDLAARLWRRPGFTASWLQ
jgi:hypothetical protein